MKSEGPELLFKLRGDRRPAEWAEMCERAGREVAAASSSPAFRASAALGALAFDLTQMRAHAAEAFMLSVAPALESMRLMGEQMAAAFAEITRPDGPLAQSIKLAQETGHACGAWLSSLSEEEREEWRRLAEDAPLCEVDLNAGGVM